MKRKANPVRWAGNKRVVVGSSPGTANSKQGSPIPAAMYEYADMIAEDAVETARVQMKYGEDVYEYRMNLLQWFVWEPEPMEYAVEHQMWVPATPSKMSQSVNIWG